MKEKKKKEKEKESKSEGACSEREGEERGEGGGGGGGEGAGERESEAREKRDLGKKKNACVWKQTLVGLLQARSPGPRPAYGRSRRQNGGRDMGIQVGNAAETDEQQCAG